MKKHIYWLAVISMLLGVTICPGQAEETESIPALLRPVEETDQFRFLWRTDPGVRYTLQHSPDLTQWTEVDGYPIQADAPVEYFDIDPSAGGGYYRAVHIDEQAPKIVSRYPSDSAFGVPRFADLSIELSDVSGIDPASVALSIGGGVAKTLASDSNLTFVDGVLRYDVIDTAHGGFGESVGVSLIVADTIGNAATFLWSFILEEEGVSRVGTVFVFGSPGAQRAGQRLNASQRRVANAIVGNVRVPAGDGGTFEITDVVSGLAGPNGATGQVLLSYEGEPPLFSIGLVITNQCPATQNEIFYREVVATPEIDEVAGTMSLWTIDRPLTELVEGSAGISDSSIELSLDGEGNFVPARSFSGSHTFPRLGFSQNGLNFKIKKTDGIEVAEVTAEELQLWMIPTVEAAIELKGGAIPKAKISIVNEVDFEGVFDVEIKLPGTPAKTERWRWQPYSRFLYIGSIFGVPVFAKINVTITINSGLTATGAVDLRFGLRRKFIQSFTMNYQAPTSFRPEVSFTPLEAAEPVPFSADIGLPVTACIELEPIVEFLVYGVGGIGVGVVPSIEAEWDPLKPEATLTAAVDLRAKPVGIFFDLLGDRFELEANKRLWEKPWDLFKLADQFSVAFDAGEELIVVERFGLPSETPLGETLFTYGGNPIPGSAASVLVIPIRNYSEEFAAEGLDVNGDLVVSNPVFVTGGPSSVEFAQIPAGSFEMGDAFSEGLSNELPTHSVYVSAFYIGRTEVTKVLWEEVRDWGTTHGYSDLRVGGGKGADHPVHTIDWFDMVKWCNARSEQDGLVPCYTVGGAIYKTGQSAPDCNWGASGYRLPSEAEWEKAARGGLAGKNFPWGNTITHSQANYYSSTLHAYDVSPTRGSHPDYNGGTDPLSSPVGSFAANSYGLYDMAGNMWERCWDWYGAYDSAAQVNPRGASPGTHRVFRGGDWNGSADFCRLAFRSDSKPDYRSDGFGFRLVVNSPVIVVEPSSEEFARIPAGSFEMGDAFSEGEADERPVHGVFVSAFYMGRHAVTKSQWDEVRAWAESNGYTDLPFGDGKGQNHPVHAINWYSMVKWCNARSEKEGLVPCYTVNGVFYKTGNMLPECNWTASGYRLPTDAEWERAARGGLSGKRFPWGDAISHEQANFRNIGSESYVSGSAGYHPDYQTGDTPFSSPVGHFAPNGFGLYDMAGNTWDWCWDWLDAGYYSSSPAKDPRGTTSGSRRVLRGGTWRGEANLCRTARHGSGPPNGSSPDIGFRLVRQASDLVNQPNSDLILYYPLNGDATDASGNSLHGTIVGAPHFVLQGMDTAIIFDNPQGGGVADEYISIPSSSLLDELGSSSFTVAIKYYSTDDAQANGRLFGNRPENSGLIIDYNSGGNPNSYFSVAGNNFRYSTGSEALADPNAFTTDGAAHWTIAVVNRETQRASQFSGTDLIADGSILNIGNIAFDNLSLGRVTERPQSAARSTSVAALAIFKKALTNQEIEILVATDDPFFRSSN